MLSAVEAECYDICLRNILKDGPPVVIPEPYYPYIPENWNGILVLAEAQNLSNPNDEYVLHLAQANVMDRIRRLYLHEWIPIQPWHDGSLPLGLTALFDGHDPDNFAVSNAVPWSARLAPGRNANPDVELQERSREFLEEILRVLKPELVVVAGRIAQNVVERIAGTQIVSVRLPSPNAMGRISGMFDHDDLLVRFPEVSNALARLPWISESGYMKNKVFFACHMVSSGRAQLQRLGIAPGPG